jgi:sugar phosphate isomerase/epimerase
MNEPRESRPGSPVSRRSVLLASAGLLAGLANRARGETVKPTELKGNIRHSIVYWCFHDAGEKWDFDTMCRSAREAGCVSVELCPPEDWPTLKKYGLKCAIASNGSFKKGFNNPKYREELVTRTRKLIDTCADGGVPSLIGFSGYKWHDADNPKSGEISREEGAEHCVKAIKEVVGALEKKKITLCLEMLNTRDASHPMKGHPGYQGDDLDWFADVVRRVGSERVKLLFDVYHVQIMHGDLLRRIEQTKEIIGHIHTAGNPGRGELDETQEIAYGAVMRKLMQIKYAGYVGHEFIPTRSPMDGLRQAVSVCDV